MKTELEAGIFNNSVGNVESEWMHSFFPSKTIRRTLGLLVKLRTIVLISCCLAMMSSGVIPVQGAVIQTVHSFYGPMAFTCPLLQAQDGNFYGTTQGGGKQGAGTIFKITADGLLTTIVSFDSTNGSGPQRGLVQGVDGNLYGTTLNGGTYDRGTVFKTTLAGGLVSLASFNGTNGSGPWAALTLGTDGNFYGTTTSGGAYHHGTIFKMTASGLLTTLASFNGTNGSNPAETLLQAADGNFYGVANQGGDLTRDSGKGFGTVFKMLPDGTLTALVLFNGTNGSSPGGSLIQGTDGYIYGCTYFGGDFGRGEIFKLTADGIATVVDFHGTNGANPQASLIQASDGNFYGTTDAGGEYEDGTVFKMSADGHVTILISFNGRNGWAPQAPLIQAADGNFYGTTLTSESDCGVIFKVTPAGVMTNLLASFIPSYTPQSTLTKGFDGNFYGTTFLGGARDMGTIFKMTPSGKFNVLTSFEGTNGMNPACTLTRGRDGNFYGMTINDGLYGYGTVFKASPSGILTTLISFNGTNGANYNKSSAEGDSPSAFVQGLDGNLYGTTGFGGAMTENSGAGYGTIFKITTAGKLTTLHIFHDNPTGYYPFAGLVQGRDGSFYGTTSSGGRNNLGAFFRMLPNGSLVLTKPFNTTGGGTQISAIQARDSDLYGMTSPAPDNGGQIYKITPQGDPAMVLVFNYTNGAYPQGPLIQAADGNFYGTTAGGGDLSKDQGYGFGTVFRITPSGHATVLAVFHGENGAYPCGGLIQADDGSLYGLTSSGGADNNGTVFKIAPASYDGLFYPANGVDLTRSGYIHLTVNLDSAIRGTITISGQSYSITGRLDPISETALIVIPRRNQPDLVLNLQLLANADEIAGTISDGSQTIDFQSYLQATQGPGDPSPYTGKYSFDLISESDGSQSPGWGSSGRLTVKADGAVNLTGVLADETLISQQLTVSSSGPSPVFISLYGGKGALLGWLTFAPGQTSSLMGNMSWIKTGAYGPYYKHGFTNATTLIGSKKAP